MINPHLKHLSKLPLAQRYELIDTLNEMLIDLLCSQLFTEAMPDRTIPTETKEHKEQMLEAVLAEVQAVLHG